MAEIRPHLDRCGRAGLSLVLVAVVVVAILLRRKRGRIYF
jgi:hypothetical protein